MRRREARLLQRQIELPLGRRRLARLSLQRLRGGIDAERLQDPKNLATDSVIGTQATERDAPLRAVVHKSALAVIAPRLAPIAHVQLAAASRACSWMLDTQARGCLFPDQIDDCSIGLEPPDVSLASRFLPLRR